MQYPGVSLEINNPNFDIKEAPENDQIGFIRKVYGILTVQILVTIIVCGIVMSNEVISEFVQDNIALFFVAVFGVISSMITLLCSKKFARQVPSNYIILFIFTLCESYMIAMCCSLSDPTTVITAAAMTFGVTLTLTAYACITKNDFRILQGVLFVGLCSIFMSLFFVFYLGNAFKVVLCALGVIIYGIYLIVDTQLVIEGHKYGITNDDYIVGAMLIYVDIIVIFIRILEMLEMFKK